MSKSNGKNEKGKIVEINEERVKRHLEEIGRGSVEETLNKLLDEEADRQCGAARLRHIASSKWGTKAYLNIARLCEMPAKEMVG